MLALQTENVEIQLQFPVHCLWLQYLSYAIDRLSSYLRVMLRRVVSSREPAKYHPIFRPPFTPYQALCTSFIFYTLLK
jgi:hypothetical protein